MTQVQNKTNQQLNMVLAELMGWKNIEGHAGDYLHDSGRWLRSHIRDYCTDPAASLEVEAKAIEVSADRYVSNLDALVNPEPIQEGWGNHEIARLLTASPRERAEAAYITLQGAKA
ncbi:hypothetical protein BSK48_16980 [Paenibacillus odorifer]|uniref:hypothetical protein n=1 Tax=Paenibacillus odorifer TaxID=189426 RepID=UPI00096FF566|nr:hypothetical protein [Paenibacillus odorifer]OMD69170.1 hypothetical protein BSK48_16980 [Paenibacillus odorifer]